MVMKIQIVLTQEVSSIQLRIKCIHEKYFFCFDKGCEYELIGDSYCDDENNKEECFYDGGDCCGTHVHQDFCTECQCLEEVESSTEETTTSHPITTTSIAGKYDIVYLHPYL